MAVGDARWAAGVVWGTADELWAAVALTEDEDYERAEAAALRAVMRDHVEALVREVEAEVEAVARELRALKV
jgi:hypothetical protein